MNIAQIAPPYEAVPPKLHAGTDSVVNLCEALIELEHKVILFAVRDACTTARLIAIRDQSIRLDAATLKFDLPAHLTGAPRPNGGPPNSICCTSTWASIARCTALARVS